MSKKGSGKSEYCGHIPPHVRLCYRTLPWEPCVRSYRDYDHWYNLRLDALAAFQAGEQRVRFWLEWDRATMGTRDLVAKFKTYAIYATSRECIREKAGLLLLLMVTPGKEQEMRIARIATACLADATGLMIQSTTATRLSDRGPFDAIWYLVPTDSQIAEITSRSQFYHESHPQ